MERADNLARRLRESGFVLNDIAAEECVAHFIELEIKNARKQALEEAAKLCDPLECTHIQGECSCDEIHDKIRALITKEYEK